MESSLGVTATKCDTPKTYVARCYFGAAQCHTNANGVVVCSDGVTSPNKCIDGEGGTGHVSSDGSMCE